ncbi:MAG: HlyD family efflux transporter periplasmic adaptor subunit [Planctomycetaceae bacterium]|nr:HlyD family efflux transporter periplasmic adaptor subunit [Planctomycetaceae bacterium]
MPTADMTEDVVGNADADATAAYLAERDSNSPLAETLHELPSIASRGLVYLLVLFAAAGIFYCSVAQIDVTQSARASVVPEGDIHQIQPDADGVLTRLLVAEGQVVERGQTLAIIDSREVVSQLSALRSSQASLADSLRNRDEVLPLKEQQFHAKIDILKDKNSRLAGTEEVLQQRIATENASLKLSEELHALQQKRQVETLKRIDIEIRNAQASVDLWARELLTMEKLVANNAASQLEFLGVKRSKGAAAGEVEKLYSMKREAIETDRIEQLKLRSARNAHEKSLAEIQELISNTHVAMQSAKLEQIQLEQEIQLMKLEAAKRHDLVEIQHEQALQQARLNLPGVDDETIERVAAGVGQTIDETVIMAPVAGTVGQLFVRNAGEAVMRGRPLLTIIPGETRLVTEIYIPNKDVGLLKADMPTRCKFDAFPFAEHGVLTGRLETIAPSAVRVEGSPAMYRAYSSLDQDYFLIKGTRVPLRPGMEATVEIVTDRKSILSILAQPLLKIGDPRDAESDGSVRQTFSKTSAPHATRSVVQNDRAERSDVQTAAGGVQ